MDYNFLVTAESLTMFGITEENVSIAKQNIESMEKELEKEGALSHFIKFLKDNPSSFIYVHSYLLSLFLSKMVLSFDWDSRSIREKICYVAFFHDITLLDDELAKVNSDEELYREHTVEYDFSSQSKIKSTVLSPEQIEKIKNHASEASLLIEKFPSIPMGVSQIIKEHHGSKSGIGFNDTQSATLQPLAIIFMVTEDFILQFLALKTPSKDEVVKIISQLKDKYNKGSYRKAVLVLEEFLNH